MKKNFFVKCKIKDIIPETEDSVSILLDIPESHIKDFEFKAGQHLTFKTTIENEEIRRSYSLSTAPHKGVWRIGVKKVKNGRMSSFLNSGIRIGDEIEVMPAMGNFILESEEEEGEIVFFGAGSGITPILSMITHLLEKTNQKVTLFYGNKGVEKIMYREEIEGLKNRFMDRFSVYHILSKEKLGSPLFTGRINARKCEEYHKVLLNKDRIVHYFLCGPSAMIFDLQKCLLELGVDKEKIKFELFTTDDIPKSEKGPEIEENQVINSGKIALTRIKLDGMITEINIPFDGKPILEMAEDHGIDVPYSCKGGVCSTCKARLIEGQVKMDVNYALEEDEVEEGFILTCQSHPLTEKIYVDYDQG